ncbi:glycosyltransferase family 4 protein [Romboutsia sedimentorum]|uniref:glycosyltransferase family 4 protein n=1 Tax=Romboutsia sedimentorum TaxID=1368474 RepID=UPI0024DED177|nr:glycosyltransferase family 4 protein [Romboutsia sedimentorum]MDK2584501.1 glycosyltransferase family 4 protein [Romboutsia sedimentorum]
MKKILILTNNDIGLYNFRKELPQQLLKTGYDVTIALPYGKQVDKFKEMGCNFIETPMNRRGMNVIQDLKLLIQYRAIIKKIKPNLVITYTIKPNIYGGIACRISKQRVIHTVTGLGSVFIRDLWIKKALIKLNQFAFKEACHIFFLNKENKDFYKNIKIIKDKQQVTVVPGSGVNLKEFQFNEYPNNENIKFTFIARVIKDKGIEEFLESAKNIKDKYSNIEFEVVGSVDEEIYLTKLKEYEKLKVINYLGHRYDIQEIIKKSSCIVLPSYGEGRGTVLQEGAAVGRPLITCDIYGCRDNVDDGYNGYLCKVADCKSLQNSMERFINLSFEEKKEMGLNSRVKAKKEFDRNIVIKSYINEINKIV